MRSNQCNCCWFIDVCNRDLIKSNHARVDIRVNIGTQVFIEAHDQVLDCSAVVLNLDQTNDIRVDVCQGGEDLVALAFKL